MSKINDLLENAQPIAVSEEWQQIVSFMQRSTEHQHKLVEQMVKAGAIGLDKPSWATAFDGALTALGDIAVDWVHHMAMQAWEVGPDARMAGCRK